MSLRGKFAAWVAVLSAAVLAVPAALAVLIAWGLPDTEAAALARILEWRAPLLVLAAMLVVLVCGGAVKWLFAEYVVAARVLAEQARVIRSVNPGLRLSSAGAPEIAVIAAEINALASAYSNLQRDSEALAAEARSRLEEERNRLAALMSELTQGVMVCNAEGIICCTTSRSGAFRRDGCRPARQRWSAWASLFGLISPAQICTRRTGPSAAGAV